MALTTAEKQRLADLKEDVCSIVDSELDNYTFQQWSAWLSSYYNYCAYGGSRPPHRPPI